MVAPSDVLRKAPLCSGHATASQEWATRWTAASICRGHPGRAALDSDELDASSLQEFATQDRIGSPIFPHLRIPSPADWVSELEMLSLVGWLSGPEKLVRVEMWLVGRADRVGGEPITSPCS